MARLNEKTVVKKVKPAQKQKIIVEEGHTLIGEPTDYKVLHTEFAESAEKAKARVEELKTEYPEKSIHYFSV